MLHRHCAGASVFTDGEHKRSEHRRDDLPSFCGGNAGNESRQTREMKAGRLSPIKAGRLSPVPSHNHAFSGPPPSKFSAEAQTSLQSPGHRSRSAFDPVSLHLSQVLSTESGPDEHQLDEKTEHSANQLQGNDEQRRRDIQQAEEAIAALEDEERAIEMQLADRSGKSSNGRRSPSSLFREAFMPEYAIASLGEAPFSRGRVSIESGRVSPDPFLRSDSSNSISSRPAVVVVEAVPPMTELTAREICATAHSSGSPPSVNSPRGRSTVEEISRTVFFDSVREAYRLYIPAVLVVCRPCSD
eukprot:COSAG05_NODE_2074_length_3609_cov_4.982336_4_plen_300_part_00